MHYNLALIGFGNVARSLARLLIRKQAVLKSKHGITISFTGISTGKHVAVNQDCLDIEKARALVEGGKSISEMSVFPVNDRLPSSTTQPPTSCSRSPPSTRRRDSPPSTVSAQR